MNVLAAGIYGCLSGNTALGSLLSGSASVYRGQAVQDAALPYVVFSFQGGGPENIERGDLRNLLVMIRGYATGQAQAGSVDAAIERAMLAGTLAVAGYSVVWCARESDLSMVENTPTGAVFSEGATYRIRLSGSA